MALFGLIGKKISDPDLAMLDAKEKQIFALEKHELDLGSDLLRFVEQAETLIKTGISNTKHLFERKMHNRADPHDLDFEDAAGQFKDAFRLLTQAKEASVSFVADVKELSQAILDAEKIIKARLPHVKDSQKEIAYFDLFRRSEFIALNELPPLDSLISDLAQRLRHIEPFIKDLDSKVRRPKDHGDHEIMNANRHLLNEALSEFAVFNRDIAIIHKRVRRFKEILRDVHHRMKALKIEDKTLHREILAYLQNARRANERRKEYRHNE
jgi:hypothetical protein